MERIDKILSNMGFGSRKEIKKFIKDGLVYANEKLVEKPNEKYNPYEDEIIINGEKVYYRKYIYLMMNKPQNTVSATFDNLHETVIDLLPFDYKAFDPFPVGRLDKDTVGLLLITNDGELNHKLLSPRSEISKVYYAYLEKEVEESAIKKFERGIVLDDGYKCLPGKLEIVSDDKKEARVTIMEGKFHQVKRMFHAVDNEVIFLEREKFGPLKLDENLEEGEFRELTEDEVNLLKEA